VAVDAVKAASHVSYTLKVRNVYLHDISHSTDPASPAAKADNRTFDLLPFNDHFWPTQTEMAVFNE